MARKKKRLLQHLHPPPRLLNQHRQLPSQPLHQPPLTQLLLLPPTPLQPLAPQLPLTQLHPLPSLHSNLCHQAPCGSA